ncbi:hypothetical protein [Costertonia aggregata]|uniref:Type VI secretion system baseplate subunit TssG n=1 Tax=Costertonia aggregata TaxID=343403 RepID=A0A7H9ATT1_9FLAO|nr:hypothetical protein [Costertonia aggregata]QLG46850.1 hypothetical protein HYG79_16320 [Costertonia aggregata]
MYKKNSPEKIKKELVDVGFDLKAETFAAYLEDEIPLRFAFSQFFKRRFTHDITNVTALESSYKKLEVTLSRRGFYNVFPERFFHSTYSSTPFVETMVADYKNRKKEEYHSRNFFQPLEEEFFLNKVAVEQEENNIFSSLGSPELVSFLTKLWNIDEALPKAMATKILKTMPFMHKIAGDLPLLTKILETIIHENITVKQEYASLDTTQEENTSWQLGVNLATSANGKTFLPRYIFTVDKVRHPNEIDKYLPNGSIILVIRFFLEHTLPFECDYEVNFTLPEQKQDFIMSEKVYAARLGVSSTI